ncbi:ArnT family glycosyltransferase [Tautonia marina]|uniref:ArnT family glycosyltransferase n=1 Tax=Tautonia marina TaxID=2653855 RepID=UPI0012608C6F|nr:phospholipid carrier-dependent glycosyltransferase [Tautonia marina]
MPADGTDSETLPRRSFWTRLGFVAVGLFALASFGFRLADEPSFIDEWAYLSQAYFGPLWWEGDWNDPAWLEYPAIDLPPLPKYLIGAMIQLGGRPMPDRADAFAWYNNTATTFGGMDRLVWTRWPTVVLGALGCLALAAIGAMSFGTRAGLLAGVLLAINPLYRMHARRAMSDVPTEAFILLALAVALWAWRELMVGDRRGRAVLAMTLGAGSLAGLAALAKLSGGLATMTLVAWAALAVVVPGVSVGRKGLVVGAVILAGLVAYATFIVGNPVLTADPKLPQGAPEGVVSLAEQGVIGRTLAVMEHRSDVSRGAQEHPVFKAQGYPVDGLGAKLAVVGVQGFGRFGPLGPRTTDSIVRYDWNQDWGALVWGPIVLAGGIWSIRMGGRQLRAGQAPTTWAVLVQFLVAMATVTAFIPMAWDRYMLPIQSGAAVLGAAAVSGVIGLIWRSNGPGDGTRG